MLVLWLAQNCPRRLGARRGTRRRVERDARRRRARRDHEDEVRRAEGHGFARRLTAERITDGRHPKNAGNTLRATK